MAVGMGSSALTVMTKETGRFFSPNKSNIKLKCTSVREEREMSESEMIPYKLGKAQGHQINQSNTERREYGLWCMRMCMW